METEVSGDIGLSGNISEESWVRTKSDGRDRWRVDIQLGASPHRYVMHFSGTRLITNSVAIEQPNGEPVPVTVREVSELADRFSQLEKLAREAVHSFAPEENFTPSGQPRRKLTEAFLRDVVRRHAEHAAEGPSPTTTLAREERVSVASVKHWLRKAREAGIT